MNIPSFDEKDLAFMSLALDEAMQAKNHHDVPVGAVIVNHVTGEVIATGHNTKEKDGIVTGHAEINAIQAANIARKDWRLTDCTLYVTLEPCPMCTGAILASRIQRVVCGAKDAVAGAMGSVWALHAHPIQSVHTSIEFGCLADEAQKLLRDFFAEKRE